MTDQIICIEGAVKRDDVKIAYALCPWHITEQSYGLELIQIFEMVFMLKHIVASVFVRNKNAIHLISERCEHGRSA